MFDVAAVRDALVVLPAAHVREAAQSVAVLLAEGVEGGPFGVDGRTRENFAAHRVELAQWLTIAHGVLAQSWR